jgi:hypothetical protein
MMANSPAFEADVVLSEEIARAAGAAALRRIHSFAMAAPRRHVFAAIATLTELSARAEASLESSANAMAAEDGETAALELARATALMDRLTVEATIEEIGDEPSYLRRRRQSER